MLRLFISYAKKDTQDMASELRNKLNSVKGVNAWLDDSIKAGLEWELEIEKQIDHSDAMIVLCSPELNRHKTGSETSYVLRELNYARSCKKRIIPVMAQPTQLPLTLSVEQYIDFVLHNMTIDELVEKICAELDMPYETKDDKFFNGFSDSSASLTYRSRSVSRGARRLDYSSQSGSRHTSTFRSPKQKPLEYEDNYSSTELFKFDGFLDSANLRDVLGPDFFWSSIRRGSFHYDGKFDAIELPSFFISKYPITYKQYNCFLNADDGFEDPRWWKGLVAKYLVQPGTQHWKIPDHPRENVNWYDAMAFCRWLSFKLGGNHEIDKIDSWLVRLPTEFEWEKAARGPTISITPKGIPTFNGGDIGLGETTSVYQYEDYASHYGVVDMLGNVWEWCLTDYEAPLRRLVKTRANKAKYRVVRGTSFMNMPRNIDYISYRGYQTPFTRTDDIGFRICLIPERSMSQQGIPTRLGHGY